MQKLKEYLARPWVPFVLLGLLVLAVWGKTIGFEFVWDDIYFIVKNPSIRSLANIPAMFTQLSAQSSLPDEFMVFRPLRTMFYAVLVVLGGKPSPQPWIFHLANLLWHASAAMLFFSVASRIFQRGTEIGTARLIAFLIAAGFAVHPATSEVVCWAKSLDDIMAAVFVLASTRALLQWNGNKKYLVAALVYFVLALYSKESAVPFAAVAVIILIGFHRFSWRQVAPWAAAFFGLAMAYVVHRHFILGRSSQIAPISGSYFQTLIDTVPALATYLRLLWGIPPFCIDYTYMPSHLAVVSGAVLAGIALMMVLGVLTVMAWRAENFWPAALGLLWFVFFLLPVSNLLPMMQYMAERFLYLPMIGWLLALGAVLVKIPRRDLGAWIAAVLVIGWIPISWNRADIWHDEVTLFLRTRLQNPQIPRIRENAVVAVFNLPHVHAMFSLDEKTHKLGVGTMPQGQPAAILQTLNHVHELLPDEQRITSALGITYAVTGQLSNAIPLLQLATRQNTNESQCWVDLGSAYGAAKDWSEAHVAYETALHMNPTNIYALRRYTQLCWNLGERQKALPYLRALHALEPNNQETSKRIQETESR